MAFYLLKLRINNHLENQFFFFLVYSLGTGYLIKYMFKSNHKISKDQLNY